MSAFYGPTKTEEENFKVLTRAADLGVTFWDTADVYGFGHNEGISRACPTMVFFSSLRGCWWIGSQLWRFEFLGLC